jgi:hypothetical protein
MENYVRNQRIILLTLLTLLSLGFLASAQTKLQQPKVVIDLKNPAVTEKFALPLGTTRKGSGMQVL